MTSVVEYRQPVGTPDRPEASHVVGDRLEVEAQLDGRRAHQRATCGLPAV